MSSKIQARTRMFARVLGPYLVIVTATALLRASHMKTLAAEFGENSVWLWVTGAFVLLSGLIVIALHQYWRGAAAIIVSVLGWLTALKGLFLLSIPQTYMSVADSVLDAFIWWQTGLVVTALVGLYLTCVGWARASGTPNAKPASSTPDLPRAA